MTSMMSSSLSFLFDKSIGISSAVMSMMGSKGSTSRSGLLSMTMASGGVSGGSSGSGLLSSIKSIVASSSSALVLAS